MAIRMMTELVALAIARSGSSDSAAAMVATSAPTMEKITTTTPAKMRGRAVREEAAVSQSGC